MKKPFGSYKEQQAAFARMSGKGTNAFNRDASVRAANTLPDTPSNRKEWANNTRRIDLEGVDTPIVKGELPKKKGGKSGMTKGKPNNGDKKLANQAKKSMTASEFIQKQGVPFYHGTDVKFKSFDIKKSGKKGNEIKFEQAIYVSKNKDFVKQYGKNTVEAYISPKAKIIDYDQIKHQEKYGAFLDRFFEDGNKRGNDAKEAFARENYDALTYANEYVIFNPKIIKTREQLIEIWDTAHNETVKKQEPMYELQRYEPNPHGHKEALTKNRTYQPMRWKGVAQSQDPLKLSNKKKNYRIINLDTLEVV